MERLEITMENYGIVVVRYNALTPDFTAIR